MRPAASGMLMFRKYDLTGASFHFMASETGGAAVRRDWCSG